MVSPYPFSFPCGRGPQLSFLLLRQCSEGLPPFSAEVSCNLVTDEISSLKRAYLGTYEVLRNTHSHQCGPPAAVSGSLLRIASLCYLWGSRRGQYWQHWITVSFSTRKVRTPLGGNWLSSCFNFDTNLLFGIDQCKQGLTSLYCFCLKLTLAMQYRLAPIPALSALASCVLGLEHYIEPPHPAFTSYFN